MEQSFKDPLHKNDTFEVHAEHVFVKVPLHKGGIKQTFLTKDAICEMYEAVIRDDREKNAERMKHHTRVG